MLRRLGTVVLGLAPVAAGLAGVAGAAGCASSIQVPLDITIDVSQPGVAISSDPAGAEVWIDGSFSGRGTPCVIALDEEEEHLIELRMQGYERARRTVVPEERWFGIPWTDGEVGAFHWRFPLFLPLGPVLTPFKRNETLWPGRVHVRLKLAADP